jgi:hypothetical protein
MATVTPPRQNLFDRAVVNRRVRHPLATIRGHIRRYVLEEGAYVTVLYAAICFWVWLALDYLPWAVLSFDWLWSTNESTGPAVSVTLRAALLTLLVLGLIAVIVFKVVRRVFREFNDTAVALLLERRFPRQLGDRLITAVELADPEMSQKYGYSQAMVDRTIQEAAERVEKLPVKEIFRWGRLRFILLLAGLATVGGYLLLGAGYCAATWSGPGTFWHRFNQTAGIWTERNVLMQSSYWPPNTCLELVRFPGKDLRVPRDDVRPDVVVRAVKWAYADSGEEAPRGWRALTISDVETLLPQEYANLSLPIDWSEWIVDLDDLDPVVSSGVIPPAWHWQGQTAGHVRHQLAMPSVIDEIDRNSGSSVARQKIHLMLNWKSWTVDRLEHQLKTGEADAVKKSREAGVCGVAAFAKIVSDRSQVAKKMRAQHPQALVAFEALLEKLEELADDPSMGRTLRKMREPSAVIANRKMEDPLQPRGTTRLTAATSGKWLFPLGDLKKDCTFIVTAHDYSTPTRSIKFVAPPELERLTHDKEEPAYIYYRFLDDPDFLKGKWQHTRSAPVGLTGDYSKIRVPWQSSVKLTVEIDRPVKKAAITDVKKQKESTAKKPENYHIKGIKDGQDVRFAEGGFFKDAYGEFCAVQTIQIDLYKVTKLLEFQIEYLDGEFVKGSRHILVVPLEDYAPGFSRNDGLRLAIAPRLVDNLDSTARNFLGDKVYLITPDAFLKLRGTIEDDHGLAGIQYSVEVMELPAQSFNLKDTTGDPSPSTQPTENPKGTSDEEKALLQARAFMAGLGSPGPGMDYYGYFAATYYGAIKHAYALLEPQTRQSATAKMDLGRAKMVLNQLDEYDVSREEILRLLNIPPNDRLMLLEALNLKEGDAAGLKKFSDRLKAANRTAGFHREMMDFAGIGAAAKRKELEQLTLTDPAAALVRLLEPLKADAKVRAANLKLLQKEPETTLVKQYNLSKEDALLNGFDLMFLRYGLGLEDVKQLTGYDLDLLQKGTHKFKAERRWRFLKAPEDGTARYHVGVKLTIEMTDNNILTGPGRNTAKLPYSFIIVSENELVALMVSDQRTHADAFAKLIDKLQDKHDTLLRKLGEFQKEGNPLYIVGPLDKAKQEIVEGSVTARQVRDYFVEILKEMELNRMKKDRVTKVKEKILPALGMLTAAEKGTFARTLSWTQLTIKQVEPDADKWEKLGIKAYDDTPAKKAIDDNRPAHVKSTKKVADDMASLIQECNYILVLIRDVGREIEAIEALVEAERLQFQLQKLLEEYQRRYVEWLLTSSGGTK